MHRVPLPLVAGREAARIGRARRSLTLLGVARSRSGESRACIAESKLRRRHGFRPAALRTLPFAPAGRALRMWSRAGESLASELATSMAMPPFSCRHRGNARSATYNLSIDTDPQQQEAASPQMLVVRSFLR
jgi:hypothetical protein